MEQKRYVIVEVPEDGIHSFCPQCGFNVRVDLEGCCVHCGATALGNAVSNFKVLTGPVELMQAACEMAGAIRTLPRKGDTAAISSRGNLHWKKLDEDLFDYPTLVITAPEPCQNCQNAIGWLMINKTTGPKGSPVCDVCGRSESEWTYAEPDWAGIGSGIM